MRRGRERGKVEGETTARAHGCAADAVRRCAARAAAADVDVTRRPRRIPRGPRLKPAPKRTGGGKAGRRRRAPRAAGAGPSRRPSRARGRLPLQSRVSSGRYTPHHMAHTYHPHPIRVGHRANEAVRGPMGPNHCAQRARPGAGAAQRAQARRSGAAARAPPPGPARTLIRGPKRASSRRPRVVEGAPRSRNSTRTTTVRV
ncbi:MAG: hypothetical protein J3K34DRAFT_263479 [Monoraphidium minutum]|nr:MAG: hypothetical protein J3K34DRAFT_263479 [Monoraphidium minutum]